MEGQSTYKFRPGDWQCSQCDYQNYASRDQCAKCDNLKPGGSGGGHSGKGRGKPGAGGGVIKKQGDFYCSVCGELNFSGRTECRKCGKRKDQDLENGNYSLESKGASQSTKPGDWYCKSCNQHNFASRRNCFKCNEPSHLSEVEAWHDGDWKCFDCGFKNAAHFDTCKCGRSKTQRRQGDIDCTQCGKLNFSFRKECFECKQPLNNNSYQNRSDDRGSYRGRDDRGGYGGYRGNDDRGGRGGFRGGSYRGGRGGGHFQDRRDRSRSRDRGGYQPQQQYQQQQQQFYQQSQQPQYKDTNPNINFSNNMPPINSYGQQSEPLGYQPRQGDWYCSQCGFTNFASRQECKGCNGVKA